MEGDRELSGYVGVELERHRETVYGIKRVVRADLNRRPAGAERADRGQRTDPHAAAGRLAGSGGHRLGDRFTDDIRDLDVESHHGIGDDRGFQGGIPALEVVAGISLRDPYALLLRERLLP